jgi:hypothetical protein
MLATDEIEHLDDGIRPIVALLRARGIETFESCEGGAGHAFHEPTVRFHGARDEGFRALALLHQHGLPSAHLRRYWAVVDGEPVGPHWEIELAPGALREAARWTRADLAAMTGGGEQSR